MNDPNATLHADFLTRLRAFVRRRVRSEHDADDVVQDVLSKFVEHDASIAEGSVYAWLFTVARRAIIDRSRSASSQVRTNVDVDGDIDGPACTDPANDVSVASELATCMQPMLASLAPEDRSLLQRVDMLGESQADIARELGMSLSGLKSKVQRARQRLRERLEDCCAIERDRGGQPADYERRAGRPCPCDGCGE